MIYNLLADRWELSTDTDVNYMVIGGEGGVLPRVSFSSCPSIARRRRAKRPDGAGTHAWLKTWIGATADKLFMIELPWLWVVFTLLAAGGQTVRNAMQRELTTTLGTVGATHVRFLFGFPFALLSLLGVALITGVALPRPNLSYWPWLLVGALFQIGATATMLAAMGQRSFVVVVAYIRPSRSRSRSSG